MLLSVAGVRKEFGVDVILDGVSFRIDRREKVLLLGRNGTGKTTLLKIITGQLEPDGGSVQLSRGAKIGYLRQEQQVDSGRSVLEEAEQARAEEAALRTRLEELEVRLENEPTHDELEEYATLHERFMEMEGYAAERDLRTVLQRMGFDESELDKPTSALSGGERTRLALARLLLEEPDLLILDEPTNHLDLQATEWLEGWLRGYPGAVLIVSHDRAFLEGMGDQVLELANQTVKAYPGPFEKYLKLKAEEEERMVEVARQQAQEAAKLDEYVRRFMNSQRTAQARGRLKMLQKLEANRVEAPKKDRSMAAGFKAGKRSGDVVWETKGLAKGFDGQSLFKDVDWTIQQGERWGVVGENGAGKSTLIKIILGKLDADEGQVRLGSNLVLGYFAQDVVDLDPDQSPLDYLVWEFDMLPADARNLLGRFLFSGDDVFRPIRTLSGGEKNKLVLASLTLLSPNLLVLDEPTNHLDMDSREALAEVLKEYNGTLVLISHDRYLLDAVSDHTLDVRRGGLVEWPGSYGEYRRRAKRGTVAEPATKKVAPVEVEKPAMSPRELSKEIGRLAKEVEEREGEIAFLELKLKDIERQLESLSPNADILAITSKYQTTKEEIEGVFAVWGEQTEALERLRALQGA